jgi:adenylate cyclase
MKRFLIPVFILGALVAGMVCALQMYGILFRPEFGITEFISKRSSITHLVAGRWQYLIVTAVAFGVAWVTLVGGRRGWAWWVIALLVVELLALSAICALYHVLFQPLPALLAVLLSFALVYGYLLFTRGSRARQAMHVFSDHVSAEQLERVISGKFNFDAAATNHEATVILCDVANKHDLAEEVPPENLAGMMDRFVRFATQNLKQAGAYIQVADGEGVVGVFGFPVGEEDHAGRAAAAALRVQSEFKELQKAQPDFLGQAELHMGLSSGTVVAARMQNDDQLEIVPIGEPFELARRFCQANRIYGSRILLGTQTFELAAGSAIARPIDFLGGSTRRERFEVYELLSLAEGAPPEVIARRDNFWNGVVLFRERRWEEAYAEFQKACGANGNEDGPLQLYLRRLEPLVLHLTNAPPTSELLPTT